MKDRPTIAFKCKYCGTESRCYDVDCSFKEPEPCSCPKEKADTISTRCPSCEVLLNGIATVIIDCRNTILGTDNTTYSEEQKNMDGKLLVRINDWVEELLKEEE